jgi:hypothetical protein
LSSMTGLAPADQPVVLLAEAWPWSAFPTPVE